VSSSGIWKAELKALISTLAATAFGSDLSLGGFDSGAEHPTPVMFVHGLGGDRRSFRALRDFLLGRGLRNFTSFSYPLSIDYQRLAPELGAAIDAACEAARTDQLDVVGHSLGGLIARYLIETRGGGRIRRLVSLGSPHYLDRFARCELAIFGQGDWLISPPSPRAIRASRVALVSGCGHLSL
jgi:triacylglycerol esterase/lipase EstA (alpha/beta hydrolase family)